MTGLEERVLLGDYLQTCRRLFEGLSRAIGQVAAIMPLDATTIATLAIDTENDVLAYLKRFEQFEDALGRTIKTVVQIMALGKVERLFPRDVANKAESLGILDDADDWSEAARARNALVHEYPLRPDKRAAQINAAWSANDTLAVTWAGLQSFVDREGLL